MDAQEKRRLIEGWIAHFKNYREKGVDDSFFWAFEELDNICRNDPRLCLELILQILSTDSSDPIVENLAAGPLEDLLGRHGNDVVDLIEEYARTDSAFRMLLGGVWQNTMSNDLWARIQRAAGEKW